MLLDAFRYIYPLPLLVIVIFPSHAGNHIENIFSGDVRFYGQVVNAACSVSADSRNLVVQMGQVRSNQFISTGDWEDPQTFQIKLEDCDTSISQNAGVLFTGESDNKDPLVFRAGYGASAAIGIGIGIFDAKGNLLAPNTSPPWFAPLNEGETVMNYTARYRSTDRTVKAGSADAQLWFNVVYQ